MKSPADIEQHHKTSSLWATTRAILWSFLGIRRRADFHQDVQRLRPLQLMMVGIALTFVFVLCLMVLVSWIAGI